MLQLCAPAWQALRALLLACWLPACHPLHRVLLPLPQAGWLRLNMGALHYAQRDYGQAARQFRMALDQTPPSYRRLRLNTQRNIGLACVRSGRYRDAADAFTAVMQARLGPCSALATCLCPYATPCACCLLVRMGEKLVFCRLWLAGIHACITERLQEGPDHQTGYNLVLCAAALGDADLMRSAFTQLLQVGGSLRRR